MNKDFVIQWVVIDSIHSLLRKTNELNMHLTIDYFNN